jgi:hypothetical protein
MANVDGLVAASPTFGIFSFFSVAPEAKSTIPGTAPQLDLDGLFKHRQGLFTDRKGGVYVSTEFAKYTIQSRIMYSASTKTPA